MLKKIWSMIKKRSRNGIRIRHSSHSCLLSSDDFSFSNLHLSPPSSTLQSSFSPLFISSSTTSFSAFSIIHLSASSLPLPSPSPLSFSCCLLVFFPCALFHCTVFPSLCLAAYYCPVSNTPIVLS